MTKRTMKPNGKRFWDGSKRRYYPSFAIALKDAVKFASFWPCAVFLFLAAISLLTGDTPSRQIVLGGFLLLVCIFLLAAGMFLFENYYTQQRIIKSVVLLLPEECRITCIEYKKDNSQYRITITYKHRSFVAIAEYPNLWIREKDVRGSLGALKMTDRNFGRNRKLIHDFANHESTNDKNIADGN